MKVAMILSSGVLLLVLGWRYAERTEGQKGEALVVYYFGATDVGFCTAPENIERIRKIKADFSARYKECKVKYVMVCLDENINQGLKFVDRHGRWDEISIGGFFYNEHALRYLNRTEIPVLPHIQVYLDAYATGKWHIPVITQRVLLVDLAGGKDIQKWVEKDFPLAGKFSLPPRQAGAFFMR